jgi:5-methylcytosine-specific restriction enzyme subunit McrC
VLRGRLRESEQLRRRHALPVPLEVRFDEFSIDVPENQLLRAATETLLRLPLRGQVRHALRRLLLRLAGVSALPRGCPHRRGIPAASTPTTPWPWIWPS